MLLQRLESWRGRDHCHFLSSVAAGAVAYRNLLVGIRLFLHSLLLQLNLVGSKSPRNLTTLFGRGAITSSPSNTDLNQIKRAEPNFTFLFLRHQSSKQTAVVDRLLIVG